MVVQLPVAALGRSPAFPLIRFIEDEAVFPAVELRLHRPILFQPVEVFQEKQP